VTASESDADVHGLALSRAWDESTNNLDNDDSNCSSGFARTRIISSYSKGSLALHDIHFKKYGIDDDDNDDDHCPSIQVEESQRWDAHTMFGCPSEVWTTCFASNRHYSTYSNSILSGGDDCKMKLWDLRVCHKPMHVNDNFEAGVTVVSYHPFLEHIFAVGSYDEKIRICDMRKLGGGATAGMPLDCIHDVGGGVWRIKWNPLDGTRMLVGAMHGGCRVLQIEGMENANAAGVTLEDCVGINVRTVKEFREHQSMAYGADWILSNNPESGEAAASCSFYDKAAFIWSVE
jgi:diphthamide biosynthesis protein 7